MNCPKNEHTPYKYGRNLQVCVIFLTKYLHISQKCCTFASAFAKNTNALLNGVMVALQILVLSVWVRVLVEQQNERDQIWSLFFSAATLCRLIRLSFLLLFHLLHLYQPAIITAQLHQLVVTTLLNYLSLMQHANKVSMTNRT